VIEQFNAPVPPASIDAIDVEMYSLTGPVRFDGSERSWRPPATVVHTRPDGVTLTYFRQGERYELACYEVS
jgi:hypothetical protein